MYRASPSTSRDRQEAVANLSLPLTAAFQPARSWFSSWRYSAALCLCEKISISRKAANPQSRKPANPQSDAKRTLASPFTFRKLYL
uniref:Uncharacterized protein n=1 Tax=Solibacter usitatus (strain Ellin6076) TaxID=234267 RepID=Q01XP5_SOLUE